MSNNNPFTGSGACNAMIGFDAPLGVKPAITPSRGRANHYFSGGYDLAVLVVYMQSAPHLTRGISDLYSDTNAAAPCLDEADDQELVICGTSSISYNVIYLF